MIRAALALLVLSAPVAAQELRFSPDATERCLAQGRGLDCAGLSADTCMEATPGGSSTAVMVGCLDRELGFWDARLNAAYKVAMTKARAQDAQGVKDGWNAPPLAEPLRAMQRAWIGFRDAQCDFERAKWGGGTGGGPATLACLMVETARQTLILERGIAP